MVSPLPSPNFTGRIGCVWCVCGWGWGVNVVPTFWPHWRAHRCRWLCRTAGQAKGRIHPPPPDTVAGLVAGPPVPPCPFVAKSTDWCGSENKQATRSRNKENGVGLKTSRLHGHVTKRMVWVWKQPGYSHTANRMVRVWKQPGFTVT